MKKHEALEAAVADYSENVRQLGEVARQLTAESHPQSEVLSSFLKTILSETKKLKFSTFSNQEAFKNYIDKASNILTPYISLVDILKDFSTVYD